MSPEHKLMHSELIKKVRPWTKTYTRSDTQKLVAKYRGVKDGSQSAPVERIKRLLRLTEKLLREINLKKF
jgi:hypothetical protein